MRILELCSRPRRLSRGLHLWF